MWFRNMMLFTFDGSNLMDSLNRDALPQERFTPCSASQEKSSGFIPPGATPNLMFNIGGECLMALCTEKKVLPPAVIKALVAEMTLTFVRERGHQPNKRSKNEIRDEAINILLPQAFSVCKVTRGWISAKNNLLVIDTASATQADLFVVHFIRLFKQDIKLRPLRTVLNTSAAMTSWVAGEPPPGFVIDNDATFANSSGRSHVTYAKTALQEVDVQRQISTGKRITSLALTAEEKISFSLVDGPALRRVSGLGVLMQTKGKSDDGNGFAADFLLMADAFTWLLAHLMESLDGIADPDAGEATDIRGPEVDIDPLYDAAHKLVVDEDRASISLVQRHLRIGYNRAGRLIEELETRGVVSHMDTRGNRTVLKTAKVAA